LGGWRFEHSPGLKQKLLRTRMKYSWRKNSNPEYFWYFWMIFQNKFLSIMKILPLYIVYTLKWHISQFYEFSFSLRNSNDQIPTKLHQHSAEIFQTSALKTLNSWLRINIHSLIPAKVSRSSTEFFKSKQCESI
jgi:hypothetical protein